MFGAVPYKTKQFFFVLIKLSIVVGAFYFIYHKLTTNHELDFQVFGQFLSKNDAFTAKNIVFLVILSIFNWFFEILKWQHLVSFFKKISFLNSLEQSLGSLTASLFTPNRIGEYGVKAMYYSRSDTKKILALNLLGNFMQMATTVLFGFLGCYLYFSKYSLDIEYYKVFRIGVVIFIIVIFPIIGLKKSNFSIRGISMSTAKIFYTSIPWYIYFKGLLFSIIRYLIFSFQFYFLLKMFGLTLDYVDAMTIITTMYLLASIIPTLAIFDVVLKGSVAVYLFSVIKISNLSILSVVTLMWILNVVLPSLLGAMYVLKFKLPKQTV
ncbi:hypothetical protein C1T31_02985 [Hanstruepera neustonica]|uniref:Lysylphosphatidylglycerol synthetase n=1 Tax=Hanstruepera neustonica TaxID=1445657 RepID=A0A2K1E4B7_9FLAO|nr:lysylphosphatidylglycerol synthase domain-containing protein [Hanstruepera neustonica]PNQ75117.1 hypothetical protein C1T31_02985 [Hanstruepera neustonica]